MQRLQVLISVHEFVFILRGQANSSEERLLDIDVVFLLPVNVLDEGRHERTVLDEVITARVFLEVIVNLLHSIIASSKHYDEECENATHSFEPAIP